MNPLDPVLFPWLALVLGLCLGSFYNVCILRGLSGESIVTPRSKCPYCSRQLAWWENLPLISFVLLRGRCRTCKVRISLQYPFVELLSGLWALAVALRFGATPAWCFLMILGGILMVASFIDLHSYILPDDLTLPGLALALAGAPLFLNAHPQDVIMGAAAGGGGFWLLQKLYFLLRRIEGLGTGDIKLMFLLGALLGWRLLPLAISLAAITALVASLYYIRRAKDPAMRTQVPFGPFLSLGAMLCVLYGDVYWEWYLA